MAVGKAKGSRGSSQHHAPTPADTANHDRTPVIFGTFPRELIQPFLGTLTHNATENPASARFFADVVATDLEPDPPGASPLC